MASLVRQVEPCQPPAAQAAEVDWRVSLRRAVRDPAELCRLLELPAAYARGARLAGENFPLLVPREYLARIRPGDPRDPLLRQVLPEEAESRHQPGDQRDPVGDLAAQAAPGLLVKYRGRALLLATGTCPVHCRYCFRRHFPYAETVRAAAGFEPALTRLAADRSLREVILSGGDPLMLSDRVLAGLADRLRAIRHIRRLRIHTRLPIMIPSRVNRELLAWLAGGPTAAIVVVHVNHPRELDRATAAALERLVDAGIVVLNQAVLLAGVNDRPAVLARLCERLVDLRVIPYYLHQLDRVEGAAHFEVSAARGRRLIAALRRRLPGYAVPRYARERAGAAHKLILS